MKTAYIFILLLFFSGCSSKNAFYYFNMSEHQELSAQSFKRIKLIDNEEVLGTFSSIYLNEVYPKRYNKNEYFLIHLYLKDFQKDYNITLNSHNSLRVKELEHNNRFSSLTRQKGKWSRYYLVSFEETDDLLSLELYINNSKSASISYIKNKQ